MQYILSEDEYQELKSRKQKDIHENKQKLQELCSKIADTMPIKWGWSKDEKAEPWGCILTKKNKYNYDWYCDSCPVRDICPYHDKRWSQ